MADILSDLLPKSVTVILVVFAAGIYFAVKYLPSWRKKRKTAKKSELVCPSAAVLDAHADALERQKADLRDHRDVLVRQEEGMKALCKRLDMFGHQVVESAMMHQRTSEKTLMQMHQMLFDKAIATSFSCSNVDAAPGARVKVQAEE